MDVGIIKTPRRSGLAKSVYRGAIGALFFSLSLSAQVSAQCVPYSTFQGMSLNQLQTLQAKVTYVGIQDKVVPSVVFTSTSQAPNVNLFSSVHKPGVDYSNDLAKVNTFNASTPELKAVLNNLGTLPAVTGGGVDPSPFFSISFFNPAGGNVCFESVVSAAASTDLFTQLRASLQSNASGLQRITDLGCPLSVVDPLKPTDVTMQVGVTFSGLRLNRTTRRYIGTVTLKNNGTTSITVPLSLVVGTPGNVTLVNRAGTTCGTVPAGRPFLNVSLAGNVLPAGATVQANPEFTNADGSGISTTIMVLAGPGTR